MKSAAAGRAGAIEGQRGYSGHEKEKEVVDIDQRDNEAKIERGAAGRWSLASHQSFEKCCQPGGGVVPNRELERVSAARSETLFQTESQSKLLPDHGWVEFNRSGCSICLDKSHNRVQQKTKIMQPNCFLKNMKIYLSSPIVAQLFTDSFKSFDISEVSSLKSRIFRCVHLELLNTHQWRSCGLVNCIQ